MLARVIQTENTASIQGQFSVEKKTHLNWCLQKGLQEILETWTPGPSSIFSSILIKKYLERLAASWL